MRRWIAAALLAVLAAWQAPAHAQPRVYSQAELDALLAPIALYPDPVLSDILVAATHPEELREAAAWSRANPRLAGEDAVRAVEPVPWHPSVKALVAFPELLARMDESPQWRTDLATAFLEQEPHVMDTVQGLRRRAQASGSLRPSDQYSVEQQGGSIAVYPVQPHVVYVPYYDPYVVYGPWWWPAYRPVFWRPWHPRHAVFVSAHTFSHKVDWHRRHVVWHQHHPHHANAQHWRHHPRALAARVQQHAHRPAAPVTVHNHAHAVRSAVQAVPEMRAQQARPPAAQTQRPQARRDHRSQHGPVAPATAHGHAGAVRSFVQSVPQLRVPELRHQPRAEHRHGGRQQARQHRGR
jgi:hypothetical protein